MTIRGLARSILLAGMLLALLVGSHVLPDPCLSRGDDCCSAQSSTHSCNTPCCAGMQATPEVVFRLDMPVGVQMAFDRIVSSLDFTPPDPLVRPPIAA